MPTMLTDQEKREVQMFGVTIAGMEAAFNDRLINSFYKITVNELAMSMISDAQEEYAFDSERANQTLNRVKYLLDPLSVKQ